MGPRTTSISNGCRPARRKEQGASTVEFAIIAPLLFFLLLAIVDVCVLFWVNLSMQHAVREGTRYAVTGRVDLAPAGDQQRYLAVIQKIWDSSMGLFDRLDTRINGIGYGEPGKYNNAMFGVSGQIFVLQLDCTWPVLTPMLQPFFKDGKYTFSVAATMRNEAF